MLKIIVIGVLIAHGIGHSMGLLAAWTTIPSGLTGRPWVLGESIAIDSAVGRAFSLLWLVAMIGTVGAGLGLLFGQEWWRPLAVAAGVISLIAIVPWINTMPLGSAIGAVAVDVILLVCLLTPLGDPLIKALR
jgi:hypothetical protein